MIEREKEFAEAWEQAKAFTVMPYERAWVLWHLARYSAVYFPGALAELGTGKGGTAMLIANAIKPVLTPRMFITVDTFNGIFNAMPENDGHPNGDFCLSNAEKEELFTRFRRLENIMFFAGKFSEVVQKTFCVIPDKKNYHLLSELVYCFAHFDGDTYASAKEFTEFFYPRMAKGGYMLFDDYGWPRCAGVKKALDEFEEKEKVMALPLGNYQAVIQKL